MRTILIALAAATLASAQTERVFHLTQNETAQQMQEIATTIRSVADIPRIWVDDAQRTVSVGGTAAQLDLAGWFIQQLDRSAPPAAMQDYQPATGADDLVRVFFLSHVETPQQLQEIVTNVRSVVDLQRVFVYNALHAFAVRGPIARVTMAAWLVSQLDQASGTASPAPNEFRMPDGEVARVFNVTNPQVSRELQEMVVVLRAIADIQRIFVYNKRMAISLRSTPDREALAEWLVAQLDRPAPAAGGAPGEYTFPGDAANQVRVLYFARESTPRDLQAAATQIRTVADVQRIFIYTPRDALAMRGTPEQIASAEKLIAEMRKAR